MKLFKKNRPVEEQTDFEQLGYYLEFMIDGKYIGSIVLKEPDRDIFGYYSRRDFNLDYDIELNSGKIIPAGTPFYNRLYPLCGKLINKQKLLNYGK